MLWLGNTGRIRVSKIVKVGEKFATAFVSSSSKKQDGTGYEYSNWTASFISDARKAFDLVTEHSVLTVTKGYLTNVPYDKGDGTKVYNNPRLVILDFEVYRVGSDAGAEVPDEDDIPF